MVAAALQFREFQQDLFNPRLIPSCLRSEDLCLQRSLTHQRGLGL
jgi:hypothetical protein